MRAAALILVGIVLLGGAATAEAISPRCLEGRRLLADGRTAAAKQRFQQAIDEGKDGVECGLVGLKAVAAAEANARQRGFEEDELSFRGVLEDAGDFANENYPWVAGVLGVLALLIIAALRRGGRLRVPRSAPGGDSGEAGGNPREPDPSEPGLPVGALLEAVDGDAPSPLGRRLTDGERAVLGESNLAWRLRWMALRRVDDNGKLVPGFLREAVEVKRRRFGDRTQKMRKPTANPGSNWLSIGPRNINGRIRKLAINPRDPKVIYAASAGGGVWKTTDGGHSWRPTMNDEEPSLAIGAIALDPSDPDTIYAGTGEPVYVLSGPADTPDHTHSWWYEGAGVLRSTNGGDEWELIGEIENDHVHAIAVDPSDPTNVLCAGYASDPAKGGLCQLTSTGWRTVEKGIFTDVLFDAANPGRAYAAKHGGGVLKSTNHGNPRTWQAKNDGLPSPETVGRMSLTLAAACPSVLYAQIEDAASKRLAGVYRSDSAAEERWVQMPKPGVYGSGDVVEMPYWCSFIAADPTDPTGKTVWSGGMRVAVNRDGGAGPWIRVTSEHDFALPHVDQQHAMFVPGEPERIILATDGGVFAGRVRTPRTVDWEKISPGLVVTQLYDLAWSPACESMVGGGSQDNGSLVTTGGRTWRHVLSADGGYMAFHPSRRHVLFAQRQFADYWCSQDGGRTFRRFTAGLMETMKKAAMASVLAIGEHEQTVTLFSGTDRVYRHTAAEQGGNVGTAQGDLWTQASVELGTVTEIAIAPSDPTLVYAGTIDGKLFRADDGGATSDSFKTVGLDPSMPKRWLSGVAVDPQDPNVLWVTYLGRKDAPADVSDHVWRGERDPQTGGLKWDRRTAGLSNAPVGALVIDPNPARGPAAKVMYLACDAGVFRSTDDGASWAPFERGLPNTPVVDLALDPRRRILYAATHGRGAYKLHLDRPCPDVALCIRDNLLDTGDVSPSPCDEPDPWQPGKDVTRDRSPDIKVFAAAATVPSPLDGIWFDAVEHTQKHPLERLARLDHTDPVRGTVNRVGVQVHNFGWTASARVTVTLLWAPMEDAATDPPPLPGSFWQVFPEAIEDATWTRIGQSSVDSLLPDTPWVTVMDWNVPDSAPGRACLLAIADTADDSVKPETELEPSDLATQRRQIAYRIVTIAG